MSNKKLPFIINQYIILFILLKLDVEMKILNEDLEKYILNDEDSHDFIFIFIYSIVICLTGFLTVGMMGEYDHVNKKFIFYMNDFFHYFTSVSLCYYNDNSNTYNIYEIS